MTSIGNIVQGPEYLVWKTRQVADIHRGIESSNPRFLKEYKGVLYFQAHEPEHGEELWVADANIEPILGEESTDGGRGRENNLYPAIFADLMPGIGSSSPSFLEVHNNYLFFSAEGIDLSWMVIFFNFIFIIILFFFVFLHNKTK